MARGSYHSRLTQIMREHGCDRDKAKAIYAREKSGPTLQAEGQQSIAAPAAIARPRASEVVGAAEVLLAKAGSIEAARKALNFLSDSDEE